jgi:hypothetical protein
MLSLQCPSGEELDQFLAGSQSLDRTQIEAHLTVCPYCQYYVTERSMSEVRTVIEPVPVNKAIVLRRMPGVFGLTSPARLAADTGETPRGEKSMMLTSSDNNLMLKAVLDERTKETWLFLLAEESSLYANALVRPFGGNQDYVTDERGRANLGKINWPSPENYTAEVFLPMASFSMRPAEISRFDSPPTVLTSPKGDEIRVSLNDAEGSRRLGIEIVKLTGADPGIPIKIAIREGTTGPVQMIRSGSGTKSELETSKAAAVIEIYLFR